MFHPKFSIFRQWYKSRYTYDGDSEDATNAFEVNNVDVVVADNDLEPEKQSEAGPHQPGALERDPPREQSTHLQITFFL